jgi:hypothetical protein
MAGLKPRILKKTQQYQWYAAAGIAAASVLSPLTSK